jgi:protein tyrosine phosphatase
MFKSLIFFVLAIFSLYAAENESFITTKNEAQKRWEAFQVNRHFKSFEPGRSDSDLRVEFENIYQTRRAIWATDGYELANHLLKNDLVRAPGCIAFLYNNTVPYYNASTVCIGDKFYIACEGPRSKDVNKFFNLLVSQHVTHLVRLTSSYEGWNKKCHPYWDGFITESNGNAYLNVPTDHGSYAVQAFHLDCWKDHQGIDPEELLSLVLLVREGLNKENALLAVHCSAGVGRTGTFLAGLAIVDEIDQGCSFSIEEIVYKLSLQRVHSVAKLDQYITLHKLAEIYLSQKNKKTALSNNVE